MSPFVKKEGPEGGALEAARGGAEAAALLDCRVAAGLQAKPLDGTEEPEQFKSGSPRRRTPTSPSILQPFAMDPEPDRPRATPPLSTSSPPLTTSDRLHPSSPSSLERQGAGLQHRDDVAVEAMDRAALLPLPQAVPLLSTTFFAAVSRNAR
jgi:hypothetical protein